MSGVGASKHYSAALGYAAIRATAAEDAEYWLAEVVRLLGLLMFATLAAESYADTLLVVHRLECMPEASQPLLPLMMRTVRGIAEERERSKKTFDFAACSLRWAMATEERCHVVYAELVNQACLMWQGTKPRVDDDGKAKVAEEEDRVSTQRRHAFGEESQTKILEALDLCDPLSTKGLDEAVWQERSMRLIKQGWLPLSYQKWGNQPASILVRVRLFFGWRIGARQALRKASDLFIRFYPLTNDEHAADIASLQMLLQQQTNWH